MSQYDLDGIAHIDITEILQNSTLESAIETINNNFKSLSQIADIDFVDFVSKKIEQRINKGDVSTYNIGKPGLNGISILDDTVKNNVVIQGSEFISYNKFGRNVYLVMHLLDSVSETRFDVPSKFLPIVNNNIIETTLLSTENGDIIYNSETNKIYKVGNLSGDIVLTYLSKFTSIEYSDVNSANITFSTDNNPNITYKITLYCKLDSNSNNQLYE